MSNRVGGADTCGGDPWAKVREAGGGLRREAARPRPGRHAAGAGRGPSGVGGALRGPSPADKGLAAPPSPGAARRGAARARALQAPPGLGAYLGRPTRPGRRGQRVRDAARGGLFRGVLSPSGRGGGVSSSSGSGRLSLRLPLRESPRWGGKEAPGRRGRDRQRGRHLAPRGLLKRGGGNAPEGGGRRGRAPGRGLRAGRGPGPRIG